MIDAVWSDGSDGAASAALVAASSLGLEYELVEGDDPVYAAVAASDATLMFCVDTGAAVVRRVCELCSVDAELGGERKGKPLFVVEWDEKGRPRNPRYTAVSLADWVRRWLYKQGVGVLHVTGDRGPSIEEWVVEFLMEALDQEAWDGQAERESWGK